MFDFDRPNSLGVCTDCCLPEEVATDFLDHAARDLPDRYLREWLEAAFSNGFGFGHLAWLLPRYLEAMADGGSEIFRTYGEEPVRRRMRLTHFPDRWPERAVSMVERFADALLSHRAAKGMAWMELDDLLSNFCTAGLPLARFTEHLGGLPDRQLAALLHGTWNVRNGHAEIYVGPSWWSPTRTEWWDWQTSDALLDRMAKAGIEGDRKAAEISDVIHFARASTSA